MICTQPNGRKHQILNFMEIALSNSYHSYQPKLDMMKGGTSRNFSSFYFHNFWINVEIMTQNVIVPIRPVQYLACQNTQRMHRVTLYTKFTWSINERGTAGGPRGCRRIKLVRVASYTRTGMSWADVWNNIWKTIFQTYIKITITLNCLLVKK